MKHPLDYLLDLYGCKSSKELEFYLGAMDIILLTEMIEEVQADARNAKILKVDTKSPNTNVT